MKSLSKEENHSYSPKRDGTIDEYMQTHDGIICNPLFRGYKPFKLLWDKGYLEPGISTIKLIGDSRNGDESYRVLGKFEVGIGDSFQRKDKRKFDVRDLLKGKNINWEVSNLAHTPISRTVKPTYFVFDYTHDKKNSAFIPFISDLKRMAELSGFFSICPEEHKKEYWIKRCLDELVRLNVKEVFSTRGKNIITDEFLGFTLHYDEAEKGISFHYNFVNPEIWSELFKKRGIELREFNR